MRHHPNQAPTVRLYYTEPYELAAIESIGDALAGLGLDVEYTSDFAAPADIGIYSGHSNRFFDFDRGEWKRPVSAFSVISLHDLGQANGGEGYWENDSWHIFDLGLLPGPAWERLWAQAEARGTPGPFAGMRTVGWPKFDHVFRDPAAFFARVDRLRAELGLRTDRRTVLLACSWSNPQQLRDAMSTLPLDEVDLVVKYPALARPEPNAPWYDRLNEAFDERHAAEELARRSEGVAVADESADLFALLALADVVLSNGSNVLYEGVLMGTPGISIRDWEHPAGRHGELTTTPTIDLEGVLTGSLASLPVLMEAALAASFQAVVASGGATLIAPESRGRAGADAAAEILALYDEGQWPRPEPEPEPPAAKAAHELLLEELAQAREELAQARDVLVGQRAAAARLDRVEADLADARAREALVVEALRRAELEADRLREDLAQVSEQLGRSTRLLRREETSVARPVARRLYRVARRAGQALPPETQRRVRAGLAPIARRVAPGSPQADAYGRASGAQAPLSVASSRLTLPTRGGQRLPGGKPGAVDVVVLPVIDWHFRIQRPQHLSTELARRGHRVIYLTTEFDRDRAGGAAYSIVERVDDLVWVVRLACPSPLPRIYRDPLAPHQVTPVAEALQLMLHELGLGPALLLAQHPFWEPVLWASGQHLLGYDLIDDHAGFEGTAPWVLDAEARLLDGVDLVTVTAASLAERAPGSVLIRNAADVQRFAAVPDSERPTGRPVIGYFGAIAHWFDVDLVGRCADAYPDYDFVLIGSAHGADVEPLRARSNVSLLGELPYAQLPAYLARFHVCMIPFHIIPLTEHTNPVKAYEYLSAGRPVVATAMPEVRLMAPYVHVADNRTQFVDLLATAVAEVGDRELSAQRRAWAAQHSWAARAELVERAVAQRTPKVSVVVLCYNNLAFTRACLDSLERLTGYPAWELVVVDNASIDETAEFLREWATGRDHVKLVLNEENLGFAGGNNSGLAAATGEFLVMLNNDTYVTEGWLLSLVRHLRDDPTLGLVGPVTNNIGNEAKIDLAYDDMEQMHDAARHYTSNRFRQLLRVPTVAFFCVAMSREVYEKVGGLDEAFGVGFFEDDDYCRRVQAEGYGIAIAEDVFVHHHLSASFDALGAARKQELFERNKAIYEAKWGTWTPHAYRAGDRT